MVNILPFRHPAILPRSRRARQPHPADGSTLASRGLNPKEFAALVIEQLIPVRCSTAVDVMLGRATWNFPYRDVSSKSRKRRRFAPAAAATASSSYVSAQSDESLRSQLNVIFRSAIELAEDCGARCSLSGRRASEPRRSKHPREFSSAIGCRGLPGSLTNILGSGCGELLFFQFTREGLMPERYIPGYSARPDSPPCPTRNWSNATCFNGAI
jgi:hypothetical protein